MKDPLTPNLPEGWNQWALSNDIRLIGLGLILLLNVWVCIHVIRCTCLNRQQKKVLCVMTWVLPVLGLFPIIQLLYRMNQRREVAQRVDRDDVEE